MCALLALDGPGAVVMASTRAIVNAAFTGDRGIPALLKATLAEVPPLVELASDGTLKAADWTFETYVTAMMAAGRKRLPWQPTAGRELSGHFGSRWVKLAAVLPWVEEWSTFSGSASATESLFTPPTGAADRSGVERAAGAASGRPPSPDWAARRQYAAVAQPSVSPTGAHAAARDAADAANKAAAAAAALRAEQVAAADAARRVTAVAAAEAEAAVERLREQVREGFTVAAGTAAESTTALAADVGARFERVGEAVLGIHHQLAAVGTQFSVVDIAVTDIQSKMTEVVAVVRALADANAARIAQTAAPTAAAAAMTGLESDDGRADGLFGGGLDGDWPFAGAPGGRDADPMRRRGVMSDGDSSDTASTVRGGLLKYAAAAGDNVKLLPKSDVELDDRQLWMFAPAVWRRLVAEAGDATGTGMFYLRENYKSTIEGPLAGREQKIAKDLWKTVAATVVNPRDVDARTEKMMRDALLRWVVPQVFGPTRGAAVLSELTMKAKLPVDVWRAAAATMKRTTGEATIDSLTGVGGVKEKDAGMAGVARGVDAMQLKHDMAKVSGKVVAAGSKTLSGAEKKLLRSDLAAIQRKLDKACST
jgi:hypothetical protein